MWYEISDPKLYHKNTLSLYNIIIITVATLDTDIWFYFKKILNAINNYLINKSRNYTIATLFSNMFNL